MQWQEALYTRSEREGGSARGEKAASSQAILHEGRVNFKQGLGEEFMTVETDIYHV